MLPTIPLIWVSTVSKSTYLTFSGSDNSLVVVHALGHLVGVLVPTGD